MSDPTLTTETVELVDDELHCQALEAVLVEHLYAYNVEATGYADGRLIGGRVQDAAGALIGGFSGHTWGGVCVLTHVWVAAGHRGRGLGRRLLARAEDEARRRGCVEAILLTHGFQAPCFYERAGYRCDASIADWPVGHVNRVYRKRMQLAPA